MGQNTCYFIRKKMTQVGVNPISVADFHGFANRN